MTKKQREIKEVRLMEVSLVRNPPHPSWRVIRVVDDRHCKNCGSPSHTLCNR